MDIPTAILHCNSDFVARIELRAAVDSLGKTSVFSRDCLSAIKSFLPDLRSRAGYNAKKPEPPRVISRQEWHPSLPPTSNMALATTKFASVYSNGVDIVCVTRAGKTHNMGAAGHIVLTFGDTIYVVENAWRQIIEIRTSITILRSPGFGQYILPPLPCGMLLIQINNDREALLHDPKGKIFSVITPQISAGAAYNDFGHQVGYHTDTTFPAYQSPAVIE